MADESNVFWVGREQSKSEDRVTVFHEKPDMETNGSLVPTEGDKVPPLVMDYSAWLGLQGTRLTPLRAGESPAAMEIDGKLLSTLTLAKSAVK